MAKAKAVKAAAPKAKAVKASKKAAPKAKKAVKASKKAAPKAKKAVKASKKPAAKSGKMSRPASSTPVSPFSSKTLRPRRLSLKEFNQIEAFPHFDYGLDTDALTDENVQARVFGGDRDGSPSAAGLEWLREVAFDGSSGVRQEDGEQIVCTGCRIADYTLTLRRETGKAKFSAAMLDDLVVLEQPEITLKGWCNSDTTCAAPNGRSFTVRDLFDAIEKHEARNWQGPGYMDFHYFAGLKKEAAFGASVYAAYWNMS